MSINSFHRYDSDDKGFDSLLAEAENRLQQNTLKHSANVVGGDFQENYIRIQQKTSYSLQELLQEVFDENTEKQEETEGKEFVEHMQESSLNVLLLKLKDTAQLKEDTVYASNLIMNIFSECRKLYEKTGSSKSIVEAFSQEDIDMILLFISTQKHVLTSQSFPVADASLYSLKGPSLKRGQTLTNRYEILHNNLSELAAMRFEYYEIPSLKNMEAGQVLRNALNDVLSDKKLLTELLFSDYQSVYGKIKGPFEQELVKKWPVMLTSYNTNQGVRAYVDHILKYVSLHIETILDWKASGTKESFDVLISEAKNDFSNNNGVYMALDNWGGFVEGVKKDFPAHELLKEGFKKELGMVANMSLSLSENIDHLRHLEKFTTLSSVKSQKSILYLFKEVYVHQLSEKIQQDFLSYIQEESYENTVRHDISFEVMYQKFRRKNDPRKILQDEECIPFVREHIESPLKNLFHKESLKFFLLFAENRAQEITPLVFSKTMEYVRGVVHEDQQDILSNKEQWYAKNPYKKELNIYLRKLLEYGKKMKPVISYSQAEALQKFIDITKKPIH